MWAPMCCRPHRSWRKRRSSPSVTLRVTPLPLSRGGKVGLRINRYESGKTLRHFASSFPHPVKRGRCHATKSRDGGGCARAKKRSRKFAKQLRATLTNAETILWSRLRRHPAHKFRRQNPIGPYIADFACVAAHLIVEVDGETHATDEARRYDRRRDAYLKRRGRRVLRVPNCDVYKELTAVLDLIDMKIEAGGERSPPSRCA